MKVALGETGAVERINKELEGRRTASTSASR